MPNACMREATTDYLFFVLREDDVTQTAIKRLNWGCGHRGEPGWINSDQKKGPGIDISCDIREGLPLDEGSMDYVVSIHALPEVPYPEIVPILRELRRVLKPAGVLRLALPDLEKGIEAYRKNDREYFLIPDEEVRSLGGKLIVQLIWYGWSRTLFTHDFIEELLYKAGFSSVSRCGYRETRSPYEGIVALDNRERESLFVEAVK
jgi:SAM-dependent methyltransferase